MSVLRYLASMRRLTFYKRLALAGLLLVLIATFFNFAELDPVFGYPERGAWNFNMGKETLLIDGALYVAGLVALIVATIGIWRSNK